VETFEVPLLKTKCFPSSHPSNCEGSVRPDGKPDFPQIKQEWGQAWFVQVISEIAADPTLKKAFMDLMARKKEEFLDRENNRKLVG
jgi:hypothetical protein